MSESLVTPPAAVVQYDFVVERAVGRFELGVRHGSNEYFLTVAKTHTAPQPARRVSGRAHRRNRVRTSDAHWKIAARVRSSAAGEVFRASNTASRGIDPIQPATRRLRSVGELSDVLPLLRSFMRMSRFGRWL